MVDKKGKASLIDVKTNTYRKRVAKPHYSKVIGRCPTDAQKKLNIKLVMIDYEN